MELYPVNTYEDAPEPEVDIHDAYRIFLADELEGRWLANKQSDHPADVLSRQAAFQIERGLAEPDELDNRLRIAQLMLGTHIGRGHRPGDSLLGEDNLRSLRHTARLLQSHHLSPESMQRQQRAAHIEAVNQLTHAAHAGWDDNYISTEASSDRGRAENLAGLIAHYTAMSLLTRPQEDGRGPNYLVDKAMPLLDCSSIGALNYDIPLIMLASEKDGTPNPLADGIEQVGSVYRLQVKNASFEHSDNLERNREKYGQEIVLISGSDLGLHGPDGYKQSVDTMVGLLSAEVHGMIDERGKAILDGLRDRLLDTIVNDESRRGEVSAIPDRRAGILTQQIASLIRGRNPLFGIWRDTRRMPLAS